MSEIRFILLDIEGTVSDVNFVHKVLFPYAAQKLPAFVRQNAEQPDVTQALAQVRETVRTEESRDIKEGDFTEAAIEKLLQWIKEDRKHTALKALQGLVWQEGFESGEFRAHLYPDVEPALKAWQQQGLGIGIYSSGSVHAQKLFFRHTEAGDLSGYFSHHFDTMIGAKREADAYRNIARELQLPAESVVFFSDVPEELEAASEAGMRTVLVDRDRPASGTKFREIASFDDFLKTPQTA